MENKEIGPLDSLAGMHFSSEEEEKTCFIKMRNRVLKLLYLIEDEQKGNANAELFLYSLLLELLSANSLCNNKLTEVIVKMHVLADNNYQYRKMTHAQIKRQIMESKGILDHLIGDKPRKNQ